MKIGLFDHIEDGARPLTTLFDERLQFAAAADAAGFYCLHLAEHHATPLNMVPVPGIFMGALARATKRMRMGPLVYLLPLYSPLRMIEEICMLDHLSYGRLDVGVGRGVSPYELKYHKVEHDQSREIFIDAFNCLSAGLVTDSLSYKGEHYVYENVPIALRPLQQPHPPFWYASSNEIGSTWGGEHGLHFVTLGPMATAKTNIEAYKKALAKRGAPAQPKAEFPGGAVIGVQRHIFVADTDAEAHRFAKPAMEVHLANLNWLRAKHGVTGLTSRLNVPRGATYEACLADGTVIAGSPATVRAEIERQVKELGVNYLLTYLFLGTMSLADALRSLQFYSAAEVDAAFGEAVSVIDVYLPAVIRRPLLIRAQRVGMRHGDDVVAGIDEVDFAGDAGGKIREQIKPGAAEIVERHAAMQRRMALLEGEHGARVADAGAGQRADRSRRNRVDADGAARRNRRRDSARRLPAPPWRRPWRCSSAWRAGRRYRSASASRRRSASTPPRAAPLR